MNTSMNILYRQQHGYIDDEAANPNGVQVTLSYWVSNDPYQAPHHYLLQKRMMQNRELTVDQIEVHVNGGWQAHAEEIRNAIAVFDAMVKWLEDAQQVKA